MSEQKLTDKQKIFCREYIIDWNATRAAIVAGYSEKTASEVAYENLRKPQIEKYIEKIRADLEKQAGISRLRVLTEHIKLAFSSIAHMHNTWIDRKDFEELTEDQKSCISEIQTRVVRRAINDEICDVEEIKIKLYDKQKALDSITKMLGYDAATKIEQSGTVKHEMNITVQDQQTANEINKLPDEHN